MRYFLGCLGSAIALSVAAPAFAQDTAEATSPITINGSATLVSDYRFRGISQSDKNVAIQGWITLTHESGLYATVWGSSVSGYVNAATTSNVELDLILGYKRTFGGTTVDLGVLYYVYPKTKLPGDVSSSNFIEPYLAVSHTFGPVTAKGTIAWAPKQKALALDQIGPSRSNVYLAADLSAAIPDTPLSLTAHLGHSIGPSWLATTGRGNEYTDWGLGASLTFKNLTVGMQYVDTNTTFFTPTGKDAAKGGIVATLGVSF